MSDIDNDPDPAASRRDANEATVRTMLAEFSAGNPAGQLAHVADDIVYEAPYYNEMATKRGKAEMAAMLGAVEDRFTSILYEVTAFIPALDPDLVIAEVRGDHAVKDSDRRYQNHYLMLMQFRDGKVVHWREFSNPLEYRRAVMGE
jgi:ketosteroid isomerase-like protein